MTTQMRSTRRALLAAVSLGIALLPAQGTAQGNEARVRDVRDGTVRFTFSLRPGVCGEGRNVWTTGRKRWRDDAASRDVEYDVDCQSGPGRVVIEKRGGVVRDVRFYVGGRWRAGSAVTDLGAVGAREAAAILLGIAEAGDGKASREAIFPATLVDSVDLAPPLLRLARNESRPRETRKQAVFWLGQLAEGPATAGLDEIVGDAALDRDVREQAIFALSQRPKDEGVPALMQIVRTSRDPALRRKALFWLGQSDDPRALQLIEEILAKR